jgi:glutathione S-transferase
MKLVGRYDSPYVRRVGVSLHALAVPFKHVPLSPFSHSTELRKFTAIGRMPALVLDDGETLIESAAILDHLDEIAGPTRALLPSAGVERRKSLRILASATAACDKAIAINYELRRPSEIISVDWLNRCRSQLAAAVGELEAFRLALTDHQQLRQVEITAACAYAYIQRVVPEVVGGGDCAWLARLSVACEARREFRACPQ